MQRVGLPHRSDQALGGGPTHGSDPPLVRDRQEVQPEPEAPAWAGIDVVARHAAQVVDQARRRRGLLGDPSRGVLDDPLLQPPPQVSMASVVPYSGDVEQPDRRRPPPAPDPASGGPKPPSETTTRPSEAAGDRRRTDPLRSALSWAATSGRRVVVGYADVVGVADPGTATRLLQTRVLAALFPGDVALMVAPGAVAFMLSDADLVEADRRFRHLVATPLAVAPSIRLGFVVPRGSEDADAVVGRARSAATRRWSRLRVGRPL